MKRTIPAYRDESESKHFMSGNDVGSSLSNSGFKTIYKRKDGGRRFTELLDQVSLINPEVSKCGITKSAGIPRLNTFDCR